MPEKCEWKEDDNGVWETACAGMFEFTTGGPDENEFVFCPYCGLKIEEIEVDSE